MLLNSANRDLCNLSTLQGYVQGALRKKQLIASFAKHFTENDENIICIVFQFHNPKSNLMSTIQGYVEGALRKNRMIAS